MADFPRWDQIAESEQFRSLDNGARAKLRDAYFQDFIAPTIGPEEAPKAKAEWQKLASIEVPGVGSDIKNTLAMGVQGLALDARELARRALPEGAINAIDSIDTKLHGKPSEEFIKGNIERAQTALSPEMKSALDKKWWDDDKGELGDAWKDPRAYLGNVMQSLPGTAITMLPAIGVARGVYAAQLAKGIAPEIAAGKAATAAQLAGGITEGLQQAGQTGREVRDQIRALTPEQLQDSEVLKSLMSQGMGFDQARDKLAEDASAKAMTIAGVATGAFGGMGDRVLAQAFTKGLSGNLAARIAKGAAAEGVLEELPQSYLSKVGENIGMQQAVPGTPTTQGALNEGLGGLAAGAFMGGGFASVSKRAPDEKQPEAPQAPDPAQTVANVMAQPDVDSAIAAMQQAVAVKSEGSVEAPTSGLEKINIAAQGGVNENLPSNSISLTPDVQAPIPPPRTRSKVAEFANLEDSAEARKAAELDKIVADSRLPAAEYDLNVDQARGASETQPTAMQEAFARAGIKVPSDIAGMSDLELDQARNLTRSQERRAQIDTEKARRSGARRPEDANPEEQSILGRSVSKISGVDLKRFADRGSDRVRAIAQAELDRRANGRPTGAGVSGTPAIRVPAEQSVLDVVRTAGRDRGSDTAHGELRGPEVPAEVPEQAAPLARFEVGQTWVSDDGRQRYTIESADEDGQLADARFETRRGKGNRTYKLHFAAEVANGWRLAPLDDAEPGAQASLPAAPPDHGNVGRGTGVLPDDVRSGGDRGVAGKQTTAGDQSGRPGDVAGSQPQAAPADAQPIGHPGVPAAVPAVSEAGEAGSVARYLPQPVTPGRKIKTGRNGTFRGEFYDDAGNFIGHLHHVGENDYRVITVKEGGRGEIVAESAPLTKADFIRSGSSPVSENRRVDTFRPSTPPVEPDTATPARVLKEPAAPVQKIGGKPVTDLKASDLKRYAKSRGAVAQKAQAEIDRRDREQQARQAEREAEEASKNTPSAKLLTLVRELGGLNMRHADDILGEKNPMRLGGRTARAFKRDGLGIDDLATQLHERGWITDAEYNDVDGGVQRVRDMIKAASDGQLEPVRQQDVEAQAERAMAEREAMDNEVADSIAESWSNKTEDEKEDELDAIFGSDTRSKDQSDAAARAQSDEAASEGDTRQAATAEAAVDEAAASPAAVQDSGSESPDLLLTGQSASDLTARAQERQRQESEQAQAKAIADREVGHFGLQPSAGTVSPQPLSEPRNQVDMFASPTREQAIAQALRNAAEQIEKAAAPEQTPAAQEPQAGSSPDEPRYAMDTPVFRSAMADFIGEKAPNSAPASQWVQSLDSWAKQGKFKADELEWSGVKDWLKAQGGKVTKDQVLDFVRQGGVQVQETVLGEPNYGDVEAWWNDEGGANEETPFNELTEQEQRDAAERYADEVGRHEEAGQTKFSQYTLPGGENYRELLLTLPQGEARIPTFEEWHDKTHATPLADVRNNPRLMEIAQRQYEREKLALAERASFRSGHFDQPNILAHVRFNERTDAEGKRVLFIEEIQSDWAQKGRKQGFDKGTDIAALKQRLNDIVQEKATVANDRDPVTNRIRDETKWHELATEGERLSREIESAKSNVPRAPFVEKTEQWAGLAMKRMIRWAAENGFDRVAWTNGEQQAERYDLSKHVASIGYKKRGDDSYDVYARTHDGREPVTENGVTLKRVEELFGKEIADRVQKGDGKLRTTTEFMVLSGLDLKVGGEGMRAFYDKMLPNLANDLLKKLGGGRVTQVEVSAERSHRTLGEEDENGVPVDENQGFETVQHYRAQPGFDITPAMRDHAMRGLPLFARDSAAALGPQIDSDSLKRDLHELAEKIVPQANLELVDTIHAIANGEAFKPAGLYNAAANLIQVSLSSNRDKENVLRHESVHALKSMGLFTEKEWALLERQAEKNWRGQFEVDRRYPNLKGDPLNEEAIADAFGEYRSGEKYAPPIQRLFQKISDFLDRLGNLLRGYGFQKPEDVFARVESGEVGSRQATARGEGNRYARGNDAISKHMLNKAAREIAETPVANVDAEIDDEGEIFPVTGWAVYSKKSGSMLQDGFETREEAEDFGEAEVGVPYEIKYIASPSSDTTKYAVDTLPDWITNGSAALKSAASKIDTFAPKVPFVDKVKALAPTWKKRLVQGAFDAYAPLKELSPKAYIHARLAKSADGVLEGVLLHGKPMMDADGAINGDLDGKGFLGAMKDLKGEHDRFFMWIAGNRSERLMQEDREHLFTADEIKAMKALNQGQMKDGSSREVAYMKAFQVFRDYNKAIMDIAEKTGLIDGAARNLWEHDFYVPYYRVMEDDKLAGPSKIKGLVRQQAFKKLKGGQEPLGDLMANTLRNWSHLLSASLSNQAAVESLEAAEKVGVADQVPADTKGATYVMKDGKQVHYEVNDPFLLDAVSAIESAGFKGLPMELMRTFKRYLTLGVTASPSFRIRNLLRDTLSAVSQNDMSYNVMGNLVQGFKGTSKASPDYAQMLFGGGVMRFGTYLEDNRAEHVRRLIADGVDESTILTSPAKMKAALGKLWDAYQDFGDRMENVNRAAIYKQARERGLSHLEASYQARDLLDFSMQGSWTAIRFLGQIVPFMNARAQGIYKLGRAAKDDPKRLAYVAGAVSLASIMLMLANKDDEDWKKREDWDRDSNWWFKIGETAYRIPKPFELGALGTLAERSIELMVSDEMTGKRFAERMQYMLGQTFSMNPIPQMFKPMLDVYSNIDSFTGRQIETRGMERLSKPERANAYTSLIAKTLGQAGNYTGLSPVQLDQLIRGYFGWLGTHAVMTVDLMAQPFQDVQHPARRVDDMFVVGDFVKGLPSNQSRYVEDFYKQAKQVQEVMADIKAAREVGEIERARKLMEDNKEEVSLYRLYTQAERRMGQIGKQIKIAEARNMEPDEKRARIDQLTAMRNQLAETVAKRAVERRTALQ